jgi:fibronectin type 3 domain-containing protein
VNGPNTKINSSLDPNTTYSDTTVQAGETYYYVTTAVDNQGVESAYSNQSEATIPGGGSGSENALYRFAGGAKG